MITIEIDGITCEAKPGQMLIDVADAAGIEIPRFCYHKKLSVAANCRMCLVDVEKAPKPLPACATPVTAGMVVRTQSEKARIAQQAVMEFLLINHPLDCPICDQGGECELQDVAVAYGKDGSRFHELKRVVPDKDLGPLIATEMTRCIHCTRCVRFGAEIAGVHEMGATGRGEHTRIGTYVEMGVYSELSGNLIDVCPVGALTSKPFRFTGRAWEMQQQPGLAPHDGVGSNLYYHTRRHEVLRVVPRENESVNEVWLSDRDRFSFQALRSPDRLTTPLIKQNGTWQTVDWQTALDFAVKGLREVRNTQGAQALGGLASPTATLEELYLFQKLLRGLGCDNIDHRLHQSDFSDQAQVPLYPALGQSLTDLEQCDTVLIVGSNLRKEQPLINHRLRKAAYADLGKISERVIARIMVVNPLDYAGNLPLSAKIIVAPSALLAVLAGIAKALSVAHQSADLTPEIKALLETVTADAAQQNIAEQLLAGHHKTLLLGQLAASHPQSSEVRAWAALIAQLSGAKLAGVAEAGNSTGAWLAGVLPHRGAAGQAVAKPGLDAQAMLHTGLSAYVLLGLEPELDSRNGAAALVALRQAQFVVALSAFQTPAQQDYADVVLPIALYPETSGTYVNAEGRWQSATGAVAPLGEARPAWKVLRVLGNLCALPGFDYNTAEQIKDELQQAMPADRATIWPLPNKLETVTKDASAGLERVTELPIYAVDAMVRRAEALQQTRDAVTTAGVHLAPTQITALGLHVGQRVCVRQEGQEVVLPLVEDARVPVGCALLYAGLRSQPPLGDWHGQVVLSAATV